MSGMFNTTRTVTATGDARIDGIIYGTAWADPTLYYSVPSYSFEYGFYYGANEHNGAFQVTSPMLKVIYFALADDSTAGAGFSVEGFTNLSVQFTTANNAHIRVAQTSYDPYGYGTAWGYFPYAGAEGGDVWLTSQSFDYTNPKAGDYANITLIHEIGHALGLSHGHDGGNLYGRLPYASDSMEFSVMTYRSYVGAGTSGYSNETYGYAQSWMMLDIAALQHIYGADYTTNSGDTVYSWAPNSGDTLVDGRVAINPGANRIFATIWDGGGIDTYDLSAYSSDLAIDLAPGGHSLFSATQQADLGNGRDARGNIFNALLHDGDTRSLIENAIGGSGNDVISGNSARNVLKGNAGNDRLLGLDGNDKLIGGAGNDDLYGGNGNDALQGGGGNDRLYGGNGADRLLGAKGNDRLFGGKGNDILKGSAGRDVMDGGAGKDILFGGGGADVFRFTKARDSTVKASDTIRDFVSGVDMIDLSRLVPGDLTLRLDGGFANGDASVITAKRGGDMIVRADIDGDGSADFRLVLADIARVTVDDFIL